MTNLEAQPETCKAGGVRNWAKIGIVTSHPNYDLPHVTGFVDMAGIEVIAKNCVFCGQDLSECFVGSIYEF